MPRRTIQTSTSLRKAGLVAAVVVAIVGAATAAYLLTSHREDCPGHWHSTFLVFMDDHRVRFNRPVFFQTPMGIHDFHMHADDQIMHYHPPFGKDCVPFGSFLARLGIVPGDASLRFNENFGANEGTYRNNATHHIEIHYAPYKEDWREVAWNDIAYRQLRPGDKVLLTYGALTSETVAAERAQVRDLPPQYLPPDPAPEGNETAVGNETNASDPG